MFIYSDYRGSEYTKIHVNIIVILSSFTYVFAYRLLFIYLFS